IDISFTTRCESVMAKITAGMECSYSYLELKEPHRLVVDFHGIQNAISFKKKQIGAAGVERVRTSFFSDKTRKATRIVFDLSKDAPYRLIEDGAGVLRIVFGETAHAPLNQTAGPVMVPEPSYPNLRPTSPGL